MKITTLGYSAPDAREALEHAMEDLSTILVDIRAMPISRYRPEWNKQRLTARYQARYLHIRDLGNKNYKEHGKPIEIINPERGIARLMTLLQQGYSLILLCACKDYEQCHRKVVVDALREELKKQTPPLLVQIVSTP